ncbi:MAG: NAD(P)H-hydrate dehydratase [Pseudomonadota bacterium]
MTYLLTAAQMKALEQAAIDSGEVNGLELMERAGRGVVAAILEEWPELAKTSHRAVVLCGPGNNGGDGFVVARLLRERGWEVEVFLYGDREKLPPDALANADSWERLGATIPLVPGCLADAIDRARSKEVTGPDGLENVGQTTIYVDALFGTGLSRQFDENLLAVIREWMDCCYEHGVAIDIPSGVCSDSGKTLSAGPYSKVVVTFECPKVGHYLGAANFDVGTLVVSSLDISFAGIDYKSLARLFEREDIELDQTGFFHDGLNKSLRQHKYHHGHAVMLAGGPGRGGAARLAARGALRIGAGLVTVACPSDALTENAAKLDAIMLRVLDDPEALADLLADDRLNAICIGPGLGTTQSTRNMVNVVLAAQRNTLLDADALTVFADAPEALFDLLHKRCVLTPHAGEFARLFPDIAEKLTAPATKGPAYSKLDATREAAARAGCTVLFKGPDTVIADPDGRSRINSAHYDRKAPWLATAGAGDVLAGFITGLLARGQSPLEAASTGAWLHVECARSFGPGLIAEDLPEELPKVLKTLLD